MAASPSRIYVASLSEPEQDTLDFLVAQWRAKRPRNNMRAAFYDMQNATRHLMTRNVPRVIQRRKFVLGWSAIAVDKLARRCNLEGFYDAGPASVNLSELGLDDVLRDNRLTLDFKQTGISSLIHACSFIVTVQGDTEAGEPAVLMLGHSAQDSTGEWDVRRRAMESFLHISELDESGEPTEMTLYLPNLNILMEKNGADWKVDRRAHSFGVPVDPIRYRPRLGRPFGSSRITRAVLSIHQQALAAMIRADVNGEAYSLPRYALLGATEEAFKNADGSVKPTWQAAWDTIWAIGDDLDAEEPQLARADIKQFNGQSPEPQNAHLRMLAQMFSGETGIPVGELGLIGDSNPTSAEALTASRDDIISEAETTTDAWAPDLSAAVTRALKMANDGTLPKDLNLQPRWRNPMHISRAAAADAGTKVIGMMPWLADTEVGMEIVGLSPDQIKRAQSDRRRNAGREILAALTAPPEVDADVDAG